MISRLIHSNGLNVIDKFEPKNGINDKEEKQCRTRTDLYLPSIVVEERLTGKRNMQQ